MRHKCTIRSQSIHRLKPYRFLEIKLRDIPALYGLCTASLTLHRLYTEFAQTLQSVARPLDLQTIYKILQTLTKIYKA